MTAANASSERADFLAQLQALKEYFEAMQPELEVTLRDPALDVEGYVVVWNTGMSAGGPLAGSGKGGSRITPNLSLDEVKMLARTMALKNAAAGLPLGGAKSGLKLDPSAAGFERQYRRFVRLCAPLLRENGGPFGGFGFDIGARSEHALWACDELKSTRCCTGKPAHMGGTDYDLEGIAGLGVAVAGGTMLVKGESPAQASFAVQGGSYAFEPRGAIAQCSRVHVGGDLVQSMNLARSSSFRSGSLAFPRANRISPESRLRPPSSFSTTRSVNANTGSSGQRVSRVAMESLRIASRTAGRPAPSSTTQAHPVILVIRTVSHSAPSGRMGCSRACCPAAPRGLCALSPAPPRAHAALPRRTGPSRDLPGAGPRGAGRTRSAECGGGVSPLPAVRHPGPWVCPRPMRGLRARFPGRLLL